VSDVARIVVIGNAAGGKSTLSRKIADRQGHPLIELDQLLWQQGSKLAPAPDYSRQHAKIIARDEWVIDGLGGQDSIVERLVRATEIVLIDMPLWMHFYLAAERQIECHLKSPSACSAEMPPIRELFRAMWEVDQTWLPALRSMCQNAELEGKAVTRLTSLDEIDAFAKNM
jgi:adenylate kinase family enzyme